MDYKVKKFFNKDLEFKYEYDFGDTTILMINVIKKINLKNNKIKIISRNLNPKYNCTICKKFNSKKICFECQNMYCKKCALNKKHNCNPNENIFDLINSPRFANCFYMSTMLMD